VVTRQRDGHRHGAVLRVSATVGFIAGTIAVVGPSATVLAVGPVATTTVTAPAIAPLLGESSTFVVTFDNTDAAAVGYGPYVDIRINTGGADGPLAAGDGFVSATMSLLGAPIVAVLAAGLPCGGPSVTHPLTTLSVPCPVGTRLFVFRLPFGSFTPNQPVALLDTTVTMSNLADVGFALSLSALPGFALGDSPTGSGVVVGSERTATVTPQIARLTKTYQGPEDETATGPSFAQRYVVSADLPKSVVFTSVLINDSLPDAHQFNSVTTATPAPTSIGEPSTTAPGGTLALQWGPITGGLFVLRTGAQRQRRDGHRRGNWRRRQHGERLVARGHVPAC
jgi:large repetitive protein